MIERVHGRVYRDGIWSNHDFVQADLFFRKFLNSLYRFLFIKFYSVAIKTSLLALNLYLQKNEKSFKLHSAFNISILSDLSDDEKSSSLPDKSDGENDSD